MANFYKKFQEKLLEPQIDFEQMAFEAFRFQALENPVYKLYLEKLGIVPSEINSLAKIPFMPIEFFKNHTVLCDGVSPEIVFRSSGTTGQQTSQHFVADLKFYHTLSQQLFQEVYSDLGQYQILALLPSYLERNDASLVFMIDNFIQQAGKHSGFFLHDLPELVEKIELLTKEGASLMLIGVTFALLDLIEQHSIDLSGQIVAETGGMKGRRKEMIRADLHHVLQKALNVDAIHSEYGMTELLSQCYSVGKGVFKMSKSMQILLREMNDPFMPVQQVGRNGGINVIDLGNIHSCCFIETKDIGRLVSKDEFEVLGRFDNSEIRGCNLMVA